MPTRWGHAPFPMMRMLLPRAPRLYIFGGAAAAGARTIRIDRPLDFAAVTDHAEWMAEVSLCTTPGSPSYDSAGCAIYRGEQESLLANTIGRQGLSSPNRLVSSRLAVAATMSAETINRPAARSWRTFGRRRRPPPSAGTIALQTAASPPSTPGNTAALRSRPKFIATSSCEMRSSPSYPSRHSRPLLR